MERCNSDESNSKTTTTTRRTKTQRPMNLRATLLLDRFVGGGLAARALSFSPALSLSLSLSLWELCLGYPHPQSLAPHLLVWRVLCVYTACTLTLSISTFVLYKFVACSLWRAGGREASPTS